MTKLFIKKGDFTKYCYVIVSGHVESYSDLDHTGHLSPGDMFLTHELMGDTANDKIVNSTYYAVGDTFLLACNKQTFANAVGTVNVENSVKINDKAGRSLEGYTHCLRIILHPDTEHDKDLKGDENHDKPHDSSRKRKGANPASDVIPALQA